MLVVASNNKLFQFSFSVSAFDVYHYHFASLFLIFTSFCIIFAMRQHATLAHNYGLNGNFSHATVNVITVDHRKPFVLSHHQKIESEIFLATVLYWTLQNKFRWQNTNGIITIMRYEFENKILIKQATNCWNSYK